VELNDGLCLGGEKGSELKVLVSTKFEFIQLAQDLFYHVSKVSGLSVTDTDDGLFVNKFVRHTVVVFDLLPRYPI